MSLPPVPPDVVNVAAPLLFGGLWNWTLYGALVVQLYVYSYNFPEDRKLLKLLAYGVFLLETLQTALNGADMYYWFVSGYGNMDHLSDPYASAFDVPIIGSIVAGAVQFFFVYRVWVLSDRKSWWLCLIISVSAAVDTIAAFSGGIVSHVSKRFISGRTLKIHALIWLVGNTVTDIMIVAAMLYYLTRRRNADVMPFSDNVSTRIMRLTIETNVLTTTNGIIGLLMVVIFSNKFYYTCPVSVLGKLYSNTLFVSLNNRISIRKISSTRGALPTCGTQAPLASKGHSSTVHVQLEVTTHVDRSDPEKVEDRSL